ncbi:MAG: AAA family ATPase [Woeseiaceae bacterium]|nr:AAA family ATPase [Woeseiaceae bacterium]
MPETSPHRRLVGRTEELASIDAAVAALAGGRGQALFFTGEPGIGKSTLARAVADAAEARDIPAAWGFAWESGGAPPYWPWTQLLAQVADRFPEERNLTRTCRRLLDGESDAAGEELQPEQARFRLLESIRTLATKVSGRSPLVMILEDLHAADPDSLRLLHYVVRHLRALPILLVGTFRDVEARTLAGGEPLWSSLRDGTVMRLARLTASDVRAYLEARGGGNADPELVDALMRATSGNPLFVNELADNLSVTDSAMTAPPVLPGSVQQVIDQQLERLPGRTRDVLAYASVIGRRFLFESLVDLCDVEADELAGLLDVALDAQVIERETDSRFGFIHVLYRDALYRKFEATERRALHLRRARYLQRLMDQSGENRRAEIALHLGAAGEAHRREAVDAWCRAARHAGEQLAFEEAARMFRRALDTFGEGPEFTRESRCRVMLEFGDMLLKKGEIAAGQDQCHHAYRLARELGDTRLMAAAALTYGSVFVIAKIDRRLVDMLEETYQLSDDDDLSQRARLLARLAAAQQPAPDPGEPMRMAREAIAMARRANDDRVLFETLKSAISALLDFAPAAERVALNTEFGDLARRFRSVPDQFRSNLRLIMDAAETADRQRLDALVDACDRIASRLDLPHYQWRVASARAMQATLDGEFAAALAHIDEAEALALEAGDAGAKITLPIQRFAILTEWAAPQAPDLATLEEQFREGFAIVPDAEDYAQPLFASFAQRSGRPGDAGGMLDANLVERYFAGMDRFCVGRLGEVAVQAGELDIARRAFDALLPYRGDVATMGIMGMTCSDPVACTLGRIAEASGRPEEAREFFEQALDIARRLRARASVARCLQALAELARIQGDRAEAASFAEQAAKMIGRLQLRADRGALPASPETIEEQTAEHAFAMRQDGETWSVAFRGQTAVFRHTKGFAMLATLVGTPDREFHVLDLASGGRAPVDPGDAGPELDQRARDEYRSRLVALDEVIEEAESLGDIGHADAARQEKELIAQELSRAFGLGGRERRSASSSERARVNVRRRVKDAIERIDAELPGAGRYLESTVKTGTYCRYSPV